MDREKISLGSFDFVKGLTMILIVWFHTTDLFFLPKGSGTWYLSEIVNYMLLMGSNTAFFIIAGFGLRKKPIGKMFHSQWKSISKPYLWTAFFRALLLFFVCWIMYRSVRDAATEAYRAVVGSALGLRFSYTIGNTFYFECGPHWFMIAMAIALCLVNLILNTVPEKYAPFAAAGVSLVGMFLKIVAGEPLLTDIYCIADGALACFAVYVGYWLKTNKVLQRAKKYMPFFAGTVITVTAVRMLISWRFDELPKYCDVIDYVLELLYGVVMVWLCINVSSEKKGIINLVCEIGRYSLNIFCVHTVERLAVPWYLIVEKYSTHPPMGIISIFVLRWIFILCGCLVLHFVSRFDLRGLIKKRQKETVEM